VTLEARPWLERIEPYRPGVHASNPEGSLASNESPIGASQLVSSAIVDATKRLHLYPDPLADDLRQELARTHGVSADQILVGNGSDELIFQLAWAYLANGGTAVCADPAYRMDEISTYVVGAELVKVPLTDWRHDLEAMAQVPADVAYVVNPHNPTGTVRSFDDVARFVDTCRASLVVVDEAYIDFAEEPDSLTAVPLVETGRVAVLRTFSKIHGLAGLRVGYLIAPPSLIATLRKVRAPFSVGSLAQAGALAAAKDPAHRHAVRQHTLTIRQRMVAALTAAGCSVVPSDANFLLVPVSDERSFVSYLGDHGISVRPGSALGVPGTVRISVPSEAGLALLEAALAAVREHPVVAATDH
jgi:histidinol-phosphate aminotransferase